MYMEGLGKANNTDHWIKQRTLLEHDLTLTALLLATRVKDRPIFVNTLTVNKAVNNRQNSF